MVSNFYNEVEDFQRNDLILPEFDPKMGRTDFLGDMHLNNAYNYLQFILSLEKTIGSDVRMRMEGYSYEQYCQRINKSLRYDSNKHKD